jgi:hypothetical protein
MSRREQIESMLADNPQDTFLRYALAMELANDDDESQRCLELHHGLMQNEIPYVPSFFMAGQQYARLDRIDEAKDILSQGIAHAETQGDLHAAAEMREFLGSL